MNEWQQRNAVPPLDNVLNDQWTKWQQELGDKALINGFNTFPINVMGAEDDYILGLNETNCVNFKTQADAKWPAFAQQTTDSNKDFFSRLQSAFGLETIDINSARDVCKYIMWADLHDVQLSVQITNDDLQSCDSLLASITKFYTDINKDLNFIGAIEFSNHTRDYINALVGDTHFHNTFFYL